MDDRSRGENGPQGALPVSGFLDTSVVVRYLTGDPPGMAVEASRIIDGVDLSELLAGTGQGPQPPFYYFMPVCGYTRLLGLGFWVRGVLDLMLMSRSRRAQ